MHLTISHRRSHGHVIGGLFFVLFVMTTAASAQTTTFTYQGRLADSSAVANGKYDFQFALFDAESGGAPQPQPNPVTVTRAGVQVANGVFTVQLDFGANAFPGADRYLEISVKKPQDSTYTPLTPRQPVTPTPYAIQSKNAMTALNFTGNLSGDVTGTQTATAVSTVGGETAANVASGAQIANAATSMNTANAVVRRDMNGNFNAGTITAGNVTLGTGGALTFGDGTQQTTGLDPNNLVRRNVQSGSVLVGDTRFTVTSQASSIALSDIIARFRSNAITFDNNGSILATFMQDRFRVDQDGGFVAIGSGVGIGTIPTIGAGERLMWHPNKAAFRAGELSSNAASNWDEANIGYYSWAGGADSMAQGTTSFAFGNLATASGGSSFSVGSITTAGGATSIAMGNRSIANGDFSVAIGNRATGCASVPLVNFKFTCMTPFDGVVSISAEKSTNGNLSFLTATADNQFNVRASGGIRLRTATDLSTGCDITNGTLNCTTNSASNIIITAQSSSDIGTWLNLKNSSAGGHTWSIISTGSGNGEGTGNLLIGDGNNGGKVILGNSLDVPSCSGCTVAPSDRNLKTNFASVSGRSILERLAKIPITSWNYKSDAAGQRHIGPMAQDFFAAFGVGGDDKHINLLDEGGVALVAIQGLNEEIKERDQQINQLRQRVTAQEQQLIEQRGQIEPLKQLVCLDHPGASVCRK